MKANDPRITSQNLDLTSTNTFISNIGSDFIQNMTPFITDLDAQNKTVIITDPYLFPSPRPGGDALYYQKLEQLLRKLNCNQIIYTAPPKSLTDFSRIKATLAANGIQLDNRTITIPIHDRYWICLENQKGFFTGTSPNGMMNKLCQINSLSSDDITDLLAKFSAENII